MVSEENWVYRGNVWFKHMIFRYFSRGWGYYQIYDEGGKCSKKIAIESKMELSFHCGKSNVRLEIKNAFCK